MARNYHFRLPSRFRLLRTRSTVDVTAMDDNLLDGTQTVFATANALGYTGDRSSVLVRDFERLHISTDVTRMREDAGASAAKVTIQRTNTDTAGELSITLTSSDRSELTLPTTIKIPAGQQSVEAELNSIDDSILDGDQNVTLMASAIGYANAEASVFGAGCRGDCLNRQSCFN